MTQRTRKRFVIPLLSGLLLAPTLTAAEQRVKAPAEPYAQKATAMAEQHEFGDPMLERFAEAYVGVDEIYREYSGRLQAAVAIEDVQKLQREANDALLEAIQVSNVEVHEYSAVMAALERDSVLREKLLSMIEVRR
ncbi:DUF4168 domain-containing protein [Aquisalimonas sp.]|uniref:DUF4168 domain-containing protein n=1 Tax=Aquisalimonas sp. TaxID=1872621 RepID=UPI0025C5220E|nr:DUF4168 domain-containing protein [Aquisalimonas sp.]